MGVGEAGETAPSAAWDGWTRRFTAIGARLNEAVELYRGLGYDVELRPADASQEEQRGAAACEQCFVMTLAQTIYTRRHGGMAGEPEPERVLT